MIQIYRVKFLEGMVKKCAMRMGGDFKFSSEHNLLDLFACR